MKMGWRSVALQEVAEIERNIIEPSNIASGTTYIGLENIETGGKFINVRSVTNGELASTKFAFTDKHILYGKLRPYLAKIARPAFSGVCSTDILPILPKPELDRDYLTYFLRQPSMIDLATSRSTGANLPRLSPKILAEFSIPLPPLAEQKRIAAILDKAGELRTLRWQALEQLDAMTQSIFLKMFGDPATNPKGWNICKVSDYVSTFQGGKNIDPEDEKTVTRNRVVKVSSVTSMIFRPEESKPLPDSYEPPKDHFIKPGDLLFSRANTTELVGAVAYVQSTPSNITLADKVRAISF